MMESERLAKQESKQRVASQVFALLSACLALVMITVGSVFWSQDYCRTVQPSSSSSSSPEQRST